MAAFACVCSVAYAGVQDPDSPSGNPQTFRFVLSDGNSMAGYVYGESESRPLLIMVHGASDTHAVFDFAPGYRSAVEIAQQGYGVLTLDRVG